MGQKENYKMLKKFDYDEMVFLSLKVYHILDLMFKIMGLIMDNSRMVNIMEEVFIFGKVDQFMKGSGWMEKWMVLDEEFIKTVINTLDNGKKKDMV